MFTWQCKINYTASAPMGQLKQYSIFIVLINHVICKHAYMMVFWCRVFKAVEVSDPAAPFLSRFLNLLIALKYPTSNVWQEMHFLTLECSKISKTNWANTCISRNQYVARNVVTNTREYSKINKTNWAYISKKQYSKWDVVSNNR